MISYDVSIIKFSIKHMIYGKRKEYLGWSLINEEDNIKNV